MTSPNHEQVPIQQSHDSDSPVDDDEQSEQQRRSRHHALDQICKEDIAHIPSISPKPETSRHHGQSTSDGPVLLAKSEAKTRVRTTSIESATKEDVNERKSGKESTTPSLSVVEDWWLFECLCGLFSVFCLTAIVVVLSIYKDRPLHDWQYPISVNTFVSVFTTLAESSILTPVAACISQLQWDYFAQQPHRLRDIQIFDDASRGPIGAIVLILRLRHRAITASFGALITAVALAFDPFAQQIISFPARSIAIGQTATIARASVYDDSSQDPGSLNLAVQMQGAIFRGVFALQSANLYECPSGDCQWPSFATLAVCNSCENVTAQTKRTCHTYGDSNGTTSASLSPTDAIHVFERMACEYSTPSGIDMWAWSGATWNSTWTTLLNSTTSNSTSADGATIVKIAILQLPGLASSSSGPEVPLNPTSPKQEPPVNVTFQFGEVQECTFQWCVHLYETVQASNGVVGSVNASTHALQLSPSSPFGQNHFDSTGCGDCQTMDAETIPDEKMNTFAVSERDMKATSAFMQNLFNVSLTTPSAPFGNIDGISIGPVLHQTSNISALMLNVANSMTQHVRSSANATVAYGTTFSNTTFIRVRWAWLVIPELVVLSGGMLLVILMHLTRKSKTVVWKSSVMALLFHGLHLDGSSSASEKLAATRLISEMDDVSKNINVHLSVPRGGQGLKLVRERRHSSVSLIPPRIPTFRKAGFSCFADDTERV